MDNLNQDLAILEQFESQEISAINSKDLLETRYAKLKIEKKYRVIRESLIWLAQNNIQRHESIYTTVKTFPVY